MKTALKYKNDEFFVTPLKHVLSVMDLINHSGTPKQWAIAHENSPKTQKRRVFGHASQTCTECHVSVFWIPGYPGPPAPGPHHRPIFSPGENQ
jgi:hypothetical protein